MHIHIYIYIYITKGDCLVESILDGSMHHCQCNACAHVHSCMVMFDAASAMWCQAMINLMITNTYTCRETKRDTHSILTIPLVQRAQS
jgi:hypothetical protein